MMTADITKKELIVKYPDTLADGKYRLFNRLFKAFVALESEGA